MVNPNTKGLQAAKKLRLGEKALRDNVPIRLNDWTINTGDLKDMHKSCFVQFSVLTNNLGVGGAKNKKDTSYGSKHSLRLNHIEDNPRAVISTWQAIRNEILPCMTDVDGISAVELFQAHLTGIACREFENICYDVAQDLWSTIESNHNARLSTWGPTEETNSKLTDAQKAQLPMPEMIRAQQTHIWFKKNQERVDGRANLSVKDYTFTFPPPKFDPPPARPAAGKLFNWDNTGCTAMNPCAWLRLHNHGWEYSTQFFELIFRAVQKRAFKTYGPVAGNTQIAYLTEDLKLDPSHKLKKFFSFVEGHSAAQPYYPVPVGALVSNTSEIGKEFSDSRKIDIVWNACFETFKHELTNLNCSRKEDVKGKYATLQERFLLAEQHRLDKIASGVVGGHIPRDAGGKNDKSKNKGGKKPNNPSNAIVCGYCGKKGHLGIDCFSNPKSSKYSGGSTDSSSAGHKRKLSRKEWEKKNKKRIDQEYAHYYDENDQDRNDEVSD